MVHEINNIPYVHFDFYPSNFILHRAPNSIFSDCYDFIRQNIWNFKAGLNQDWPVQIVDRMIDVKLQSMPNVDKTKLVLVCPPASTADSNIKRFQYFSLNVSTHLNLQNGFDHIKILKEKYPKYPTSNAHHTTWDMEHDLQFNAEFFAGKNIIIFDDIVTTGDTMGSFIDKFMELGAKPVLCISLLYTPKIY